MENIVLQTDWGWPIAVYLFLGGLAAGTLCVSAVIHLFTKDRFKKTIRFGAWAGTVLLIMGVFLLLFDTAAPMRAILLWQSFVNLNSWMAFGAWFLFAGIIIYGLYAIANTEWITDKLGFLKSLRTALAIIIIPLSLGIAAYTGILLGVLYNHPLWNTWFLPALFTVSAIDTGVAMVTGYAVLGESKAKEGINRIKRSLEVSAGILVVLEAVVLVVYLKSMISAGGVANASVETLTTGPLSQLFWIVFIGIGLVLPLLINSSLVVRHDLAERTRNILPLVGVLACLSGGLILRFLILLAGLPIYI